MSGTPHRITIQLDLSGYSFMIYDRSGTLLSHDRKSTPMDLAIRELAPTLGKQYASVSVYLPTWKYTLVPVAHFDSTKASQYLEAVRDLVPGEVVLTHDMPSLRSVMVFAVPGHIRSTLVHKNIRFYPVSYLLLDRINSVKGNNRLLVSFTDGMLHVVAAEQDKLLFVNSFPTEDLASAEYFIFSVAREVLFNPEHTIVSVYGSISVDQSAELQKYFRGVESVL